METGEERTGGSDRHRPDGPSPGRPRLIVAGLPKAVISSDRIIGSKRGRRGPEGQPRFSRERAATGGCIGPGERPGTIFLVSIGHDRPRGMKLVCPRSAADAQRPPAASGPGEGGIELPSRTQRTDTGKIECFWAAFSALPAMCVEPRIGHWAGSGTVSWGRESEEEHGAEFREHASGGRYPG